MEGDGKHKNNNKKKRYDPSHPRVEKEWQEFETQARLSDEIFTSLDNNDDPYILLSPGRRGMFELDQQKLKKMEEQELCTLWGIPQCVIDRRNIVCIFIHCAY